MEVEEGEEEDFPAEMATVVEEEEEEQMELRVGEVVFLKGIPPI